MKVRMVNVGAGSPAPMKASCRRSAMFQEVWVRSNASRIQ
ncbi:hypothetical protein MMEU_3658 [Mycobacterium marinum str. Europe]|nr:hypothetical protein MMEU_3658 [Mycobacterium marinum str. Europe]